MSTIRLGPPPDFVRTCNLETIDVCPSELTRVAFHVDGEPYFHRSRRNRFDAPGLPTFPDFSTCYFGLDLPVAVAETVLHDEIAQAEGFPISWKILDKYYCLKFAGTALKLADLTGASLKRLAGNADLCRIQYLWRYPAMVLCSLR